VEQQTFDKDHYLAGYIEYMLFAKSKDICMDKYHVEYFERFAVGNKPYYSAGQGKGASEATSRCLLQVPPSASPKFENLNL